MAESARHEILAERLATIEANNEHQRTALAHISQTLERVVETQAKLANQQEAISTLAEDLSYLRKTVSEQETTIRILTIKLDGTQEQVAKNKDEITKMRDRVLRNEQFTKQATWAFTAVVTPIAIYVAQSLVTLFV